MWRNATSSGVDLNLLPAVLRATAAALQEFPELNARLEGDEIVYLERYDLGVAIQTEQGWSCPSSATARSGAVEELREDIETPAEKARAGTLHRKSYAGRRSR